MKAIIVGEHGIELGDIPAPTPGPSQVLIRVRAAGLNRSELTVAAGQKHGATGGPGTVLGIEFAGEIAAVGAEASNLAPGQRVMCSGSGGYAEYAVVDWGRVMPVPDAMDYEQAATLPVALQTMHDALVTNGRLTRGQSVLIQGASSGVGLMGLQIARYLGAGQVIGTSQDAGRRAQLAAFGADLAVDSSRADWVDDVLAATGGQGVDLIVDMVSGPVANQNLAATALRGRIVNVGRLGGNTGNFDFDLHALRRITYVGVTFRTRTAEEVRDITRRVRADLWPAVQDGTLRLPIDRTFPLAQAAAAQAHMRENRHLGKIVLTI